MSELVTATRVVVVVAAVVAVAATVVTLLTVALAVAVAAPAALGTKVMVATPSLPVSAVPEDGLTAPSAPPEKVTISLTAAPPVWLTTALSV